MKIHGRPFSEDKEDLGIRYFYLVLTVVCLFLVLLTRLWYLQAIRGYEFRLLSESNRTRVQDILPPRGLIMDRRGEILVDNYPSYDLAVIREDISDTKTLTRRLACLLGLSYSEVDKSLKAARLKPAFRPASIRSGLERDRLVALETHRFELPGVVIRVKHQRKYMHERLASHVIGYLGEVSQAQLDRKKYRGLRMGDLVGQYGIERRYESHLHGRRGWRTVEVDASGRVLRVTKSVNPTPGRNIHLALDARLQRVAQEALGDKAGAIVALDPNNGDVLVMASSPTFNQNDFVQGIAPGKWKELINNPLHPMENRAISGQYSPGSTFKIIVAAAALEEGVVTPKSTVTCTGKYPFGDRTFHCWKKYGHGKVNLHRALVESCDVYFYDVGLRLGVNRLAEYCRAFGLGRPAGVGLDNEKPGLVPTREWKKKRFKVSWQKGETLSSAIGQGFNLVTPLQMALVMSTAANGGVLYKPRLVKKITDMEGGLVESFNPEVVHRLDLKPETVQTLRKALAGVVNEPRGTGRRARLKGITVGGKTGTTQVVAQSVLEGYGKKDLPYKYRDHAWFVACAPMEAPRIAMAVVVEHSGHGGSIAAPMAKQVMEAFFHPKPLKKAVALFPARGRIEPGG